MQSPRRVSIWANANNVGAHRLRAESWDVQRGATLRLWAITQKED